MKLQIRALLWNSYIWTAKLCNQMLPKDKDTAVIFDTSINTLNIGDEIINLYCNKCLEDCLSGKRLIHISTHVQPSQEELQTISRARLKIVCGTNIVSPDYGSWTLWKLPRNLDGYYNTIAMGVGWGYYSKSFTKKSRDVYRYIFGKRGTHSVRDSYTEKKLNMMGIQNVLNTGCPTMWALTPELCAEIPTEKASNVVTTLTDYNPDVEADNYMLEVLSREYQKVFLWPQGSEDIDYYEKLIHLNNVEVVSGGLDAYTALLQAGDLDYVGTRLHGGIHALNYKIRSLIIAVDHRAVEIGKDFSVPYIERSEITERLLSEIHANRETKIRIPLDNIQAWKAQFKSKES